MYKYLLDKNILLGVTGCIAAYKSAEIVRLLVREGADVRVVMTQNAARFISGMTLKTLSGSPVITDLFAYESGIEHIEQTDWADLFAIAPATANVIGKLASGIGDDALTTMALAFDRRFVIAPAMNSKMYSNPIVLGNIKALKSHGYEFTGPASGPLACGMEGKGRMSEPAEVVNAIISALYKKDLTGRHILVTAGPTREDIDPVRFIGNRSSGKMGYAIAREAARRGAFVTLISGPTSLEEPAETEVINVSNAGEMNEEVMQKADKADAVIMAAAVSDYRPAVYSSQKIKKESETLTLELQKTADIIKELGSRKRRNLLVGFAAETENLIENASKKLREKNLDIIVANPVGKEGVGFEVDINRVLIIDAQGIIMETPETTKDEVAGNIIDVVADRLKSIKR